ncbi:hypothetical protein D3C76_1038340 [compost metagenome]
MFFVLTGDFPIGAAISKYFGNIFGTETAIELESSEPVSTVKLWLYLSSFASGVPAGLAGLHRSISVTADSSLLFTVRTKPLIEESFWILSKSIVGSARTMMCCPLNSPRYTLRVGFPY